MNAKLFLTDDEAVTAMIRNVLGYESDSREGNATYLRTLIAAVQIELAGASLLTPSRRKPKAVTPEAALEAVELVHGRFYGIVLVEVQGEGLDARARNAQTNFARSATSTLRAAVRLGLNPLTLVLPATTKETLRAWTRANRPDVQEIDKDTATKKAHGLMKQLAAILEAVPEEERADVIEQVHSELDQLDAMAQFVPANRASPEAIPHMERRRRASDGASARA